MREVVVVGTVATEREGVLRKVIASAIDADGDALFALIRIDTSLFIEQITGTWIGTNLEPVVPGLGHLRETDGSIPTIVRGSVATLKSWL